MKRIALLFFGISYIYKDHYHIVDFRKSVKNYYEYIINYYKSIGFGIDIFLSTYENDLKDELLEIYNPKDYILYTNYNEHKCVSRNKHFIKVMDLCKDYSRINEINYNFVIITRFDLLFEIPFYKVDIDYNKMNITSILEKRRYICDNIYIFPFNKINEFIKILKLNITNQSHGYENIIKSVFGEINFFYNENKSINKLSFYKIIRNDKNNNLFILKYGSYENKQMYNISSILNIKDNIIEYHKLINAPSAWCWFGYNNFKKGKYIVEFDILSDKKILKKKNIGLKVHNNNPIIYNSFIDKMTENEWTHCTEKIEIKIDYILCIFIFDDFESEIKIKIKNLKFIII
jgi:hypothetical protein